MLCPLSLISKYRCILSLTLPVCTLQILYHTRTKMAEANCPCHRFLLSSPPLGILSAQLTKRAHPYQRLPLTRGLREAVGERIMIDISLPPSALRAATSLIRGRLLRNSVQHIFNENAVPSRWVIHRHMGHRAHKFPILNNGTSSHE